MRRLHLRIRQNLRPEKNGQTLTFETFFLVSITITHTNFLFHEFFQDARMR